MASRMPVHGLSHLDVHAVVRREKVGADQQEDHAGGLKMLGDVSPPLVARADLSVGPARDHSLALEESEMRLQGVTQLGVLMRVGIEDFDRTPVSQQSPASCRGENRAAR